MIPYLIGIAVLILIIVGIIYLVVSTDLWGSLGNMFGAQCVRDSDCVDSSAPVCYIGQCKSRGKEGEGCTYDSGCESEFYCNGLTCQRKAIQSGDECNLINENSCPIVNNVQLKCKLGSAGKALCVNPDGTIPGGTAGCSVVAPCASGYWCDASSVPWTCRQANKKIGDTCLAWSNECGNNLECNGWSKCMDPNDPCRCEMSGSWGSLCGDWDAAGFQWCYVKDPIACANKANNIISQNPPPLVSSYNWMDYSVKLAEYYERMEELGYVSLEGSDKNWKKCDGKY